MRIIVLLVALALALLASTSAYALPDKDFSDGPPFPSDRRLEQ